MVNSRERTTNYSPALLYDDIVSARARLCSVCVWVYYRHRVERDSLFFFFCSRSVLLNNRHDRSCVCRPWSIVPSSLVSTPFDKLLFFFTFLLFFLFWTFFFLFITRTKIHNGERRNFTNERHNITPYTIHVLHSYFRLLLIPGPSFVAVFFFFFFIYFFVVRDRFFFFSYIRFRIDAS